MSEAAYRQGVGIALFNQQGRVFVAQRIDSPGPAWQLPQGGIDRGEAPLAAAKRELAEETGIRSIALLGESRSWLRYDLPPELAAGLWRGRYRGQEQKWFAFRFLGEEREIDIGGKHAEFSAWRWVDLVAIPDLIVPFKRKLYQKIATEFAPFATAVED